MKSASRRRNRADHSGCRERINQAGNPMNFQKSLSTLNHDAVQLYNHDNPQPEGIRPTTQSPPHKIKSYKSEKLRQLKSASQLNSSYRAPNKFLKRLVVAIFTTQPTIEVEDRSSRPEGQAFCASRSQRPLLQMYHESAVMRVCRRPPPMSTRWTQT